MDPQHQEVPNTTMSPSTSPKEYALLPPTDPDSPMSWPLWKKLYTSAVSFAAVFAIMYATTTLSVAVPKLPDALNTSIHLAILAFSIPFLGVHFAPLYTPHLSERFGRTPVYRVSFLLFCFVVLGGAYATSIGQVLAIRFVAGLCAGPCAVLIEGTFADLWPAKKTITYYTWIALSQYLGAALGPTIGGVVLTTKNGDVAWLSYTALFFALPPFLALALFMPETYPREILRRRVAAGKEASPLEPALSGVSVRGMAAHTLVNPLRMLVGEPVVVMCALFLGLNFAVVFQWFVTVPVVLGGVYGFDVARAGLAFLAAVGGAVLAAVTSTVLDIVGTRGSRDESRMPKIENRLVPAMLGSVLIVASLFWVGWTANPTTSFYIPIIGTGVFVWGNMSILLSIISYIFDAYPPQGTLSALTALACFRLACAGIVPVFVLDMFANLTGAWALSVFGFIAAAMLPIPFVLFFWGERLRSRSPYSHTVSMDGPGGVGKDEEGAVRWGDMSALRAQRMMREDAVGV